MSKPIDVTSEIARVRAQHRRDDRLFLAFGGLLLALGSWLVYQIVTTF